MPSSDERVVDDGRVHCGRGSGRSVRRVVDEMDELWTICGRWMSCGRNGRGVDDLWTMDELSTICGRWMSCRRFVDDGRVVDEMDEVWTMDELWTKWMRCGRFVDDG
jgi:hypothetical protein